MANEAESRATFLAELLRHGHFVSTGIDGYYGRGGVFEDVVQRFNRLLDGFSEADGAERLFFPPLIPKSTLERAGYLESMPHLAGLVHSFTGDDAQQRELVERAKNGEDWSGYLTATDLALSPAACYPLYPTCSGTLGDHGRLVDLSASYVFRREPSLDPARLQMFRQREMVRLGTPDMVTEWRETWMERGNKLLRGLGLEVSMDVASDPFFGRGGRMMASTQRQQKLKFELLVPIASDKPTAVTSFNYHRDHFGSTFGISSAAGEAAHTACLGFGVERVTLALFKTHGLNPAQWPDHVREQLQV